VAAHPNCSPTYAHPSLSAQVHALNRARFRTTRRAPQGRNQPGRGSDLVAQDLHGGPTCPRTATQADSGCRVRERTRSSAGASSPSSRRDDEGCLSSQYPEDHILTYTPPRQKPTPRASSSVHQRSRAQDLFAHPLKEPAHERESRRGALDREERANLPSLSPGRPRR
jgi:hypothetical protein